MLQQFAPTKGGEMLSAPWRGPWLAIRVGIVAALGQVCRDLRKREGGASAFRLLDAAIPYEHGGDARTLKRFESGEPGYQPDHLEDVVAGYATVFGVSVVAIFREAVERLEAEDDGSDLALPLADDDPKPESHQSGSAGKARVAKRKRAGGKGER